MVIMTFFRYFSVHIQSLLFHSILIASITMIATSLYAVGDKEDLTNLKDSNEKYSWKLEAKQSPQKRVINQAVKKEKPGNLPTFLIRRNKKSSIATREASKAIIFPKLSPINRSGMDIGDIFDCVIEQDIKAYVGSKSPIKATITSGQYEGMIFIGNAIMDHKTKNILIWFDHLRDVDNGIKHKLKASIHSSSGELGLVGTHHSRYWQYFFASVMSRAAEGYAQATVERERNIFGNFQEVPKPENSGKVALAQAASETANQMAGRMKSAPEYVTKKGPIRTKVFITETPTLTN